MVLSTAANLEFPTGSIDVQKAYMQPCSFPRDLYVRPLKGWASSERIVRKLLKAACGVIERVRLLKIAIRIWPISQGFRPVHGLPQLFIRTKQSGEIFVLIPKVFNDLFMDRLRNELDGIAKALNYRFSMGSYVVGEDFV